MKEDSNSQEHELNCLKWEIRIFSGIRIRTPNGIEFRTNSRRLIQLIHILCLQSEMSMSRHALAKTLFPEEVENCSDRLTVLLSRGQKSFKQHGTSFLRVTSDSVWVDRFRAWVDVDIVRQKLTDISLNAMAGKPVFHIFDSVSALISPLDENIESIEFEDSVNRFKSFVRQHLQSKVVPILGRTASTKITEIIISLDLEDPLSSMSCVQLMEIYGAIGDIASIHQVFARHEDALADAFGSKASPQTCDAYERSLQLKANQGTNTSIATVPAHPKHTFGFDQFLDEILATILNLHSGEILFLSGAEGSGKSHLLSLIYHKLNSTKNIKFVDLSSLECNVDLSLYRDSDCDYILAENYSPENSINLLSLKQLLTPKAIICAGSQGIEMATTITMSIPPLEIGNRLERGSAIKFLQFLLDDSLERHSLRLLAEITDLTCGLPGALKHAASLIEILGLNEAVKYLKDDLTVLAPNRTSSTRNTLKREIIKRIESVSGNGLCLLQLLFFLKHPMHAEPLLSAAYLSIDDLKMLKDIGLVKQEESGLCLIPEPVKQIFSSLQVSTNDPSRWSDFCESLLLWLRRNSESESSVQIISKSFSAISIVSDYALSSDYPKHGLEMFALISKCFRNIQPNYMLTCLADTVLRKNFDENIEICTNCVCAIGSGYFYCGQYRRMLELHAWFLQKVSGSTDYDYDYSRIQNQIGLAYRSLGDFEKAFEHYSLALNSCQSPSELVVLHFNLACMAEGKGDFESALYHHQNAAQYYAQDTDSRLVLENTLGLLVNRTRVDKSDLNTSSIILDLFHENRFSSDKISQATLLRNIGEMKLTAGEIEIGCCFSAIGIVTGMLVGFTKETCLKSGPTFESLINGLLQLGHPGLADRIKVLSCQVQLDEFWANCSGSDYDLVTLPKVMLELLIQAIEIVLPEESERTKDLALVLDDFEGFNLSRLEDIPIIPFVEKIRAQQTLLSNKPTTEITSFG